MNEFFNMGGYAAFVWPAYALSFGLLATLLAASLRSLRESEKALAAAEAQRSNEDAQHEA